MKAWRKHNMTCARKNTPQWKLRTKHERRTHFSAEIATPSQNLYLIMAHAGLPVPEEFMSQIVMAAQKQNAARSTASNPST